MQKVERARKSIIPMIKIIAGRQFEKAVTSYAKWFK